MPLVFPDVLLNASGMTEDEARVEIACRLFDSQSLTFAQAIQWSGLTRTGFESALLERGLPVYRVTLEDLKHDLEAVRQMAQTGKC